ncbi:hypothetical protein DFJ58DRAFT_470813 [Suillus subalutaceus]|uniref:uncharacterized protein n=1 Tax=Suillus subalutaceus TaxID=48586 RepID=UPI001B87717B|nr:uncharacterized protein DFJ58DRAFT_470813 [Suillus subalutaceus]KAG1871840.1 hypothetical protein DFJ58DRAFT_470813 [Suillus subalutaceus]
MKYCPQNRVKLAFSVSRPKSATWTFAAEMLDTLDAVAGGYVRSAVNRNPPVQAEESFLARLLEQDAAAQQLLLCFFGLHQFGSYSSSHSAIDTTSASHVLPSTVPPSYDTQIHNMSGSRIKPISYLCSSLAGKRLTMKKSEGKRFPCLWKEFCTHHHLCLRARNNPNLKEELMRYIRSPSVEELVQTESYHLKCPLFASSIPNPFRSWMLQYMPVFPPEIRHTLDAHGCFNRKEKVIWSTSRT